MPASEGGLGVINPIGDLLTVCENLDDNPSEAFRHRMGEDLVAYQAAEAAWLSGNWGGTNTRFISFEQYILGRETALVSWGNVWDRLQNVASSRYLHFVGGDAMWRNRTDVEKWVMAVYEDEVKRRFGDLKIVEPTLIPVGMLSAFRSPKIVWDS